MIAPRIVRTVMAGMVGLSLVCGGACGVACGGGADRTPAPRTGEPASSPSASAPSMAPWSDDGEADAADEGLDRVGQPAPEWGEMAWLNTEPLSLRDLRGRVVLIRFWTDTCPFCRATAPALVELDAEYRDRGLTVVGMYHPKPRGAVRTPAQVAETIEAWGWRFPVALDLEWAVLDRFWLDHGPRRYTSVSFILDREGVIRHVHPGPEFHAGGPADHERCRRGHAEIREVLDALLAQPGARNGSHGL